MVKSDFIVDQSLLDVNKPLAGVEEIRRFNQQRFEMEQLTGILYEETENSICAGYLQTSEDDFWVRGHMPGLPLMPGVLMLEAVAQLCSYFTQAHNLLGADLIGFGGVDEVRFRGVVLPGDTLILMIQLIKVRRKRMIVAKFQGVVDGNIVVDGQIRGIPMPVESINDLLSNRGSE